MIIIALRLNLGSMNAGSANTLASETAAKSTSPMMAASTYPETIAIRIAMAAANPLNTTCPITASARVNMNTNTNLGSIAAPSPELTMPPVLAAEPASSRPMRATIGPIAAGGSTASIQLTPANFIIIATMQNMAPAHMNPPRQY